MIEERNYKCGDIFQDTSTSLWYILAQIDSRTFSLIALKGGNRYQDSVMDENSTLTSVHYNTLLLIMDGDGDDFRYVPPEEYLND